MKAYLLSSKWERSEVMMLGRGHTQGEILWKAIENPLLDRLLGSLWSCTQTALNYRTTKQP